MREGASRTGVGAFVRERVSGLWAPVLRAKISETESWVALSRDMYSDDGVK